MERDRGGPILTSALHVHTDTPYIQHRGRERERHRETDTQRVKYIFKKYQKDCIRHSFMEINSNLVRGQGWGWEWPYQGQLASGKIES